MAKKEFYRDCFIKTGWLPMQPLTRSIALGDVCQIRQGQFQSLLNIITAQRLVEPASVSPLIPLTASDWALSRGVREVQTSEGMTGADGEQLQWTRQLLEFSQAGSFMFHANTPIANMLLNWSVLRDNITLVLTQSHYNFRDVYVITSVATTKEWGLVVADQADARLEMTASISNTDSFTLLSHSSAKKVQCTGIACFELAQGQTAHFFKAKKLVISEAMHDRYLNQVVHNQANLPPHEVANWLNADLLNLVKSNELNLPTSIGFFDWVDLSLDDIERLNGVSERAATCRAKQTIVMETTTKQTIWPC